MSMFHELMMRKKEEIMYATIKGTLTENDGVFSGFSSSSYLQIQNAININSSTNFEMVVKVNFNNFTENSTFVGSFNRYDITLRTGTNGKVYLNAGNGNSWIFVNEESTNAFLLNTDYYFKIVLKSNKAQVFSSTNGTNWVKEIEKTFIIVSQYNFKITLGIGRISTTYFEGSIDLNNSYIKLGSTKYNLQAVVGYTVVGSPTITDGVVSGFSASDYLALAENFAPDFTDNFEIEFKVKYALQTTNNERIFTQTNNNTGLMVYNNSFGASIVDINGVNVLNLAFSHTALNPQYNGIYFWNLKGGNGNYIFTIYDGNHNKLADTTFTSTVALMPFSRIGSNGGTRFWTGNIDLNESYIKINNKLWFNGQQA